MGGTEILAKRKVPQEGATSLPAQSAQADQSIEQAIQGLGAVHDHVWIRSLHALGRRIKQGYTTTLPT